jgi:small-conductance mechanosensitive channel
MININDQFPSTTGAYVNAQKIVFAALLAGQIIFAILAWVLKSVSAFPDAFTNVTLFMVIVLAFAALFVGASLFIFSKRMVTIRDKNSLSEKLVDYRAALIMKYAFTEGASFFAIVIYMLTGSVIILGIGIAIIAYFASMWPSVERMSTEMNLNPDERMRLESPDTII